MHSTMKKLIVAFLALCPIVGMAQQNVWEIPDQPKQQVVKKEAKKVSPTVDKKYLAGAVPEVNNEVVFTLDKDVQGMSADSIYSKVYAVISRVVEEGKSRFTACRTHRCREQVGTYYRGTSEGMACLLLQLHLP